MQHVYSVWSQQAYIVVRSNRSMCTVFGVKSVHGGSVQNIYSVWCNPEVYVIILCNMFTVFGANKFT